MKKYLMTLAAVLCCAMTTVVFTACSSNEDNPTFPSIDVNNGVVINLGSIVIKPYLQFGASLADVEKYMKENYPDYKAEDTEALQSYTWENVTHYYRLYVNGNRSVIFYFANADGSNFNNVAYCYSFPMSLEPAMAELERNGFVYKGELKFDDPSAADVDHMYLSADESIEVQLCSWEKDGGKWAISFQPLDKNDLNHVEWDPKYNVFPYTHEGQTLYYRLKTDALTNQTYAICSYPTLTPTTVETLWDGYEKPVGDVEIPGTVAYDGQSYPVLDVGRCAFAYCDGITSVTIPEGVFKLGNAAFYNCLGLQTITLPDGLTVIDDNAFDFCASLHSITLPGSLATLGNSAFGYCESLQQITIPGSVSTIGEYAFNNCHSLQNVTLGEGVETIGQCAFRECGSLTDINYPSSLRVIGDYAFQYDSALASPVLLPEGFTTLGQVAFGDCVSLRYASLPSTLNSLGDWAFAVCELDTLIVASSEPPALPENTFSSYNTVLYVPVGSAEAYRQHPVWSLFTNIVEGTATSH